MIDLYVTLCHSLVQRMCSENLYQPHLSKVIYYQGYFMIVLIISCKSLMGGQKETKNRMTVRVHFNTVLKLETHQWTPPRLGSRRPWPERQDGALSWC